jgi:uncharacterized protein
MHTPINGEEPMERRIAHAIIALILATGVVESATASTEASDPRPVDQARLIDQIENLLGHDQNEQAFALANRGAAAGDEGAEYMVGRLYDLGVGTKRDSRRGLYWYRKSAEKGCVEAMNALAYAYMMGSGVTENHVKSFQWYQKSANLGNSEALVHLAAFYDDGDVVEQDKVHATSLLGLAAKQGDKSAEEYFRRDMTSPRSQPTSRAEVVSCRTSCTNGACSRVYDDGRRVQFQAQQKFNPLTNTWEWDAGTC